MTPIVLSRPKNVLVSSAEPVLNAFWWARMLGGLQVYRLPRFAMVIVDGIEIGFRLPDSRTPPGGSPLLYWWVEDFNETRFTLKEWSCIELTLPVSILDGTQISQFEDPFGVKFGIQGPVSLKQPVFPDMDLYRNTSASL
jgi:hypothetical protein